MPAYPAPRYPAKLKRPTSVEELLPRARELLARPPSGPTLVTRPPHIDRGDKVLLVALSDYSPLVVEAMCRAIREKGARVDVLTRDATPLGPPEELAAHEAIAIGQEEEDYSSYFTAICDVVGTRMANAMVETGKYDMIIAGLAGPPAAVSFPWHRFFHTQLEELASPLVDFPVEVLRAIDRKVWSQVLACSSMRLIDPEGTDVRWTNYRDERPLIPGHVLARPANIGHGMGGRDDCSGVVAGTLNHLGAFPLCRAHVEGGQVVRVEGGGRYGDVWSEKLEQYRKQRMPRFSLFSSPPRDTTYEIADPGFFWYWECAIGTNPAVFRLPQEGRFQLYANCLHERTRSGYIHSGFGPEATQARRMARAGLPWVHVHLHSLFATLEGTTAGGGNVVIVERGHLTALDDPEVRSLAARYGDADELLREVWIPAIPGINAPGDYLRDYARNPVAWIEREAKDHPLWVE